MTEMRTSELIGPALDEAVGRCVEKDKDMQTALGRFYAKGWPFEPSTAYVHGGPIIERLIEEGVTIRKMEFRAGVTVFKVVNDSIVAGWGDTLLIAMCRYLVTQEFGDEIEIPEDLK